LKTRHSNPPILLISLLLFTLCVSIYLKTLANQVYTADCGEMIAASYVLGILHATGYSAYCILNRFAITFIPFGSVAFRVSLTSAIFGALAVVFVFLYLSSVCKVFTAAFVAAILGLSYTFWSQSIVQEVYSLHMLFLSLTLWAAGKLNKKFSTQYFFLLAFIMGLSVTNHALTWFSFPAILLYLLLNQNIRNQLWKQWYVIFHAAGFFILAASTVLYFPLRSLNDCVLRWAVCHNVDGFLFHVTGRQFRNLMFNQSLEDTLINLSIYVDKTLMQFPFIFIVTGICGAIVMVMRQKKLFVVFSVYILLTAFFFLHYRIIDIEVYYLQSYLPLAVFIASGLDSLYRFSVRFNKKLVCVFWLLLFFMSVSCVIVKNFRAHDRSQNFLVFDWGMNVYNSVPPDAMLVTQGWSSPFVFFYLDHVLNYRPDIFVKVDYKGSTFFLSSERAWDTNVVSTLPIELPGIDDDAFVMHGVVYQYNPNDREPVLRTDHTRHMRTRTLDDASVFLDFHSQALKAKYIIIEGLWKLEQGDRTGAEENFFKAELEAHQNPLIYNNLSCVYFKLDQYEKAEILALKALDLDPDLVPAHHNLGNALLRMGRFKESIAVFETIQDNVVSLGRQREALGYLYLLSGNCADAQRQFRRALSLFPTSRSARMNLGIAQHRCGNFKDALKNFNILMENSDEIPEILINRANVYIALKTFDLALDDLNTYLRSHPGRLEARLSKSIVLYEMGETDKAKLMLETLLSDHPENTSILNNLGLIHYKSGDILKAISYWEESIDLNPDQHHIRRTLRELRFDKLFMGF
jgi:tetratricopeptide (TPR) repeat protein